MRGYPLEKLFEEVAFIAYHFHWAYEDVLGMEHQERHQWIEEISKINERLNKEARD